MKERRQYQRFQVHLPCTIEWGPARMEGLVTDISMGGAFITQLKGVPPPDNAFITLTLHVKSEELVMTSSVTSRVVRTLMEIVEDGNIGSMGVQFQDYSQETRHKLETILKKMTGDPAPQ